jgi:CheY-like chemotaxis protein
MAGLRTLIVDDDRDFAESIADLMEMLGHKPQLAYDGKRAVERFREQHFDVVLMDVRMPEMSGIEAFKAVKSIDPDAKVVLMTGYSMDQDLAEAVEAGALGVMHKPVDMRELEALLGGIKPSGAVLLVDDDVDYADSVREALESRGWQVGWTATRCSSYCGAADSTPRW